MVAGIVGADGFIGGHLSSMLPDAIRITRENISDIKGCEVIFNVAGRSSGNLDEMMQSNYYLPRMILEETGARYIHAGSSVEYGNNYEGPSEDSPLFPVTDYALTKAACCELLRYYGSMGRYCCNLRLYSVYGEGDRPDSLISTVARYGRMKKLPMFHNRNLARDFIYVGDVCRAMIFASQNLQKENYGEAFNIGTGKPTSLLEVAEIARKAFDIQEEPEFNDNLPYQTWYSNPRRAREKLGFTPTMELSEWIKSKVGSGL